MLEIHLYGNLRHYGQGPRPAHNCVIMVEPHHNETMLSLLARVGIPVDEINHIFFNANLLATRNKMAAYMGLPQVRSTLSDWDLNVQVDHGDRIGLFGTDMAILGM